MHHHPYISSVHGTSALIELRPRCNRRSVVGIQSFKNTPQIHLIKPLSAVTNCWIFSVKLARSHYHTKYFCYTHVEDIPSKFCLDCMVGENREQVWECFPQGDNMCGDCIDCITKIFEGGFNMKTVIPNVNFLKGCNSRKYNLTGTFTLHKVISYFWTLIMDQQILQSA